MRIRRLGIAALLGSSLLLLPRSTLHAQSAAPSVVRAIGETGEIQKWDFDAALGQYVQVWSTSALSLTGTVTRGRPGNFAVGDWNGDGLDDLAVLDGFGVTVLGAEPFYMRFDTASFENSQILLSDLDGDGRVELVTQRGYQDSMGEPARRVSVWRSTGSGLRPSWQASFRGRSYVLLAADVDDDGEKELVSASDAVVVLEPDRDSGGWHVDAELPNVGLYPARDFALVDVVRVMDVDGDGRNEILATGNSGRLTIYKHFQRNGASRYPVIWQTPVLYRRELQGPDAEKPPHPFTQGLGVGDVDCDGEPEILVATAGLTGVMHVFEHRPDASFVETWKTAVAQGASIPAFHLFDWDQDGCANWVYNGRDIYAFSSNRGYEVTGSFADRSWDMASGHFGELRVPTDAIRIAPADWTTPRNVERGSDVEARVSLKNLWAPASDVQVSLRSGDPAVSVPGDTIRLGTIGSGATSSPVSFLLHVNQVDLEPEWTGNGAGFYTAVLWLDVSAANGYRQTSQLAVVIRWPM